MFSVIYGEEKSIWSVNDVPGYTIQALTAVKTHATSWETMTGGQLLLDKEAERERWIGSSEEVMSSRELSVLVQYRVIFLHTMNLDNA